MRTETRIVAGDLLGGLIALSGAVFLRRVQQAAAEGNEIGRPAGELSIRKAGFGVLFAMGFAYIDDRNVAGVRSSVRRRIGFTLGQSLLQQFALNDPNDSWSFAIGNGFGAIAYRVWFGIVQPIPEPRLEYRGFLPWRR